MIWEERKTPLIDLRRIPPGPLRNAEVMRLVAGFYDIRRQGRVVWFLGGTA